MWDTCGQERYRSIAHSFYRGACAIIFVYDVTDADSFLNLRAWKFDVDSVNQDTNLIKVGNTGIRQRLR
jgi:GTPase SAR1 family protein